MEVVTPVKSQCKIARNDEESSLYHNSTLINFTDLDQFHIFKAGSVLLILGSILGSILPFRILN